jgi:hypothetical protein
MRKEARQYLRYVSDLPIKYDLVAMAYDQKDYLKNISMGGLCLCSGNQYLEEGTTILIQLPLIDPVFEGVGVVVWRNKNDVSYDVGVQFIDEDTVFRASLVDQVYQIEQYQRAVLEKEGRQLSGEEAAAEWNQRYVQESPNMF